MSLQHGKFAFPGNLDTWCSISSWSAEKCYPVITSTVQWLHSSMAVFISREMKHSSNSRNSGYIKENRYQTDIHAVAKFFNNLLNIHCPSLFKMKLIWRGTIVLQLKIHFPPLVQIGRNIFLETVKNYWNRGSWTGLPKNFSKIHWWFLCYMPILCFIF